MKRFVILLALVASGLALGGGLGNYLGRTTGTGAQYYYTGKLANVAVQCPGYQMLMRCGAGAGGTLDGGSGGVAAPSYSNAALVDFLTNGDPFQLSLGGCDRVALNNSDGGTSTCTYFSVGP